MVEDGIIVYLEFFQFVGDEVPLLFDEVFVVVELAEFGGQQEHFLALFAEFLFLAAEGIDKGVDAEEEGLRYRAGDGGGAGEVARYLDHVVEDVEGGFVVLFPLDIVIKFLIPVLVAGVFHRVGGFAEGREKAFGGVEEDEGFYLLVHGDEVDDGGLVVGLIDVEFVLFDGLLFFFEGLYAEEEFVRLVAGVAGGGYFDVEGIHLMVKAGEGLVYVFCLFVEVVLDVAEDFVADILVCG